MKFKQELTHTGWNRQKLMQAICLPRLVIAPHLKGTFIVLPYLIRTGLIYHLHSRPYFSLVSSYFSPRPKEEENTMEEKESWESELLEPRKELHPSRPPKVAVS